MSADEESVGSVGEEALKLFSALTEWATDSTDGLAHQVDEHLATGASECRLCPICRTVHVVREAGPEVRTHLAAAAASLMQAAAGLLAAAAQESSATPPQSERPQRPTRPGPVQHIDLQDDEEGPG